VRRPIRQDQARSGHQVAADRHDLLLSGLRLLPGQKRRSRSRVEMAEPALDIGVDAVLATAHEGCSRPRCRPNKTALRQLDHTELDDRLQV
jgi:hypothetical protein